MRSYQNANCCCYCKIILISQMQPANFCCYIARLDEKWILQIATANARWYQKCILQTAAAIARLYQISFCKLLLLQSVAVTAKRCQICTYETTHEILRNILNPNATLTVFPAFRPSVRQKNRDCYSVAIFSLFTFTFSVLIIQNSDYSDFKLQRETLS